MKTLNRFLALQISLMAFVLGFSISLCAQDLPTPAEQTIKEPKKKKKRNLKFLSLTLGVDFDEKLDVKMKKPKTKGDYRKIVSIEYSPEANAIRFSPKSEGIATLQFYDDADPKQRIVMEFSVTVRKNKLDPVAREIKSLLGDIEGINFKIVNNKVIVDGQIVIPKDMNRILTVVSQYGDLAASFVTISPIAQKRLAEFIEKDIANPEITVRALNDKFILSGVVNSEEEKQRAEIMAKAYLQPRFFEPPEKDGSVRPLRPANDGIINLITIRPAAAPPPSKAVQMVVHYVELKKDYSKAFRFSFMPNLSDKSGLAFQTGSSTQTGSSWNIQGAIDSLLPKLNWAKSHGYARILESTTLVVQDGKKGVLNSTQEIPYQTSAGPQGGLQTAFKDVGIATAITPVILGERSDSISLQMEFDISALIGQSEAGPLTARNKITSELIIRSGQSAAVGGLINNNSTTDYNKLPKGSGENPIISLYASKQFTRGQSQFVVFVTPIIKAQASQGSEKIKKKFRLRE